MAERRFSSERAVLGGEYPPLHKTKLNRPQQGGVESLSGSGSGSSGSGSTMSLKREEEGASPPLVPPRRRVESVGELVGGGGRGMSIHIGSIQNSPRCMRAAVLTHDRPFQDRKSTEDLILLRGGITASRSLDPSGWQTAIPIDLEPFLHPEKLFYPVVESPKKRSVDFLLDIPRILHTLEHHSQSSDWDCGISCVAMCLNKEQRQHFLSNMKWFSGNPETGFENSTWTIDLCYILAYYGVKHEMFTMCMGVNPDLKNEQFYKGAIDKDKTRVLNLFRNPEKYGIKVTQRSLAIEDIFYYLATSGPMIALVNANLLHCLSCRWNFFLVCRYLCCDQYQGHFIVLVGYSVEKKVVYYRNPSLSDRICQISVSDFEEARMSFGTDEDLIAIRLKS